MRTRRPPSAFEDAPVSVRGRLAAAWTSFMFLYAYVDILNFFTPGVVEDILEGRVFEFDLSQAFSSTALALMAIPILMIALSTTLPARAARVTNIAVAVLYVPVTAFNGVGESWVIFFGLGIALELIVLGLIIRHAWRWPCADSSPAVAPRRDGLTARAPQDA